MLSNNEPIAVILDECLFTKVKEVETVLYDDIFRATLYIVRQFLVKININLHLCQGQSI